MGHKASGIGLKSSNPGRSQKRCAQMPEFAKKRADLIARQKNTSIKDPRFPFFPLQRLREKHTGDSRAERQNAEGSDGGAA